MLHFPGLLLGVDPDGLMKLLVEGLFAMAAFLGLLELFVRNGFVGLYGVAVMGFQRKHVLYIG